MCLLLFIPNNALLLFLWLTDNNRLTLKAFYVQSQECCPSSQVKNGEWKKIDREREKETKKQRKEEAKKGRTNKQK